MALIGVRRTRGKGREQVHLGLGRLLVFLAGLLIVAMPITEHFWTFDRFLRGGQDFELGMLCLIASFSLAVLLAQPRQRWMTPALILCRWVFVALGRQRCGPRALSGYQISGATCRTARGSLAFCFCPPLQI